MYYFKTKHKLKRGTAGYVDIWKFTGLISPEKSDSIVMSTMKSSEAIHHTDKELELVKYKLTRRGYIWKIYSSETNKPINDEISLTCI
jgi:hypothetical protein